MAKFLNTTIDELIENFDFLGDWEERFAYLIELGKKLPLFDESERVEDNRVYGCQAMVWLKMQSASDSTFEIHADSDAFIVRGLIAVLMLIYCGKTAEQIMATNAIGTFAKLGLESHLSPTRRNGLHSMVNRIRALAATAQT